MLRGLVIALLEIGMVEKYQFGILEFGGDSIPGVCKFGYGTTLLGHHYIIFC